MGTASAARQVVEIRSYQLKPGAGTEFHRLFTEESVPMVRRRGIDVVSFGPSVADQDSYYLIRAYASVDDLEQREDAFYGSDEWRLGPRQAVLDCIDTYTTVLIEMDEEAVDALRRA